MGGGQLAVGFNFEVFLKTNSGIELKETCDHVFEFIGFFFLFLFRMDLGE